MRHETIPLPAECTRDGNLRAEVAILCEVRQGFQPWRMVRLEDLSPTGFRIAWLPDASQFKPLRIRIPGLQMLSARVCWIRETAVGCEFIEPLHIAVFENLLKQAGR